MKYNDALNYVKKIGEENFGDSFKISPGSYFENNKKYQIDIFIIGYDAFKINIEISKTLNRGKQKIYSNVMVWGVEESFGKVTKRNIRRAIITTRKYIDILTEINIYDKNEIWFDGRWNFDCVTYLNQRVLSETALNKWFYEKDNFSYNPEFKNKAKIIKIRTGFNTPYKCYKRDNYGHFHFFNVEKKISKSLVFDRVDRNKAVSIDFFMNKEIKENG